jgi:uncharacterized protein YerC
MPIKGKNPSRKFTLMKSNFNKLPEVVELLKKRVSKREIVELTGVKLSTIYKINDCLNLDIIDKIECCEYET